MHVGCVLFLLQHSNLLHKNAADGHAYMLKINLTYHSAMSYILDHLLKSAFL